MMTDEILKREDPSFWKDLYFCYKERKESEAKESYNDKEQFVMSIFDKDFSVNILIKNSTKKTALMFLTGEYIKAGFFEGLATTLDFYLKFEPKNKRKTWSLFFKGCENPNLQEDLEELFTTAEDKHSFKIIQEILEHIYIKNKDIDTFIFTRNIVLQKIDDNKEKCRFIDETITLAGENISNDKLMDLYRKRIKFTNSEDLKFFLEIPKNLERYVDMLISEGKYEEADDSVRKFVSDPFEQTLFFSKTAHRQNDTAKENELLKPLMFEAVSRKSAYPLLRLSELNKNNLHLSLFLKKSLEFIGEKVDLQTDPFPRIFALAKEKVFEFAGFTEKEKLLAEFTWIISSIPDKNRIEAKPLQTNRHRSLTQLIEYIKLSCGFEELEGLWDENGTIPVNAMITQQIPSIIFGPESLKTDFEKVKFETIQKAFLLSCGLETTSPETAEKISPLFQLVGKDKVKLVKNVRSSLQRRIIELLKLLENTDVSEIRPFIEKMNKASLWHTFYLDPDIAETKGLEKEKIEEFVREYFFKQS